MIPRQIAITAVGVTLVLHVALADAQLPTASETPPTPAPVVLTAQTIESKSQTERTIQIELAIGTEYEIYSEQKHEFLLPLKAELLDAKLQPIKCKIACSKAKTIPFDKALGGDYSVYHGKPTFVVTCALDTRPAYVSVFYHGYSKRHY